MRTLTLLLALLVLANPVFATQHENYCSDADINRQWDEALEQYPEDDLIVRLAATRRSLCNQVDNKEIDQSRAQALWEDVLTEALLERARAEARRRGLFRLFATF